MTQPSSGSIVVADAHALERLGLTSVLRQTFGIDRIYAADHFDDLVRSFSFGAELALVDCDLPGLESLEQVRLLRRTNPITKVVLVSARCSFDLVFESVRCGAHGFVPKTLGSVEMAEAFRLVMAGLIYVPCQVSEMPVVGGMRNSDGQLTPTRELSERQRQVVRLACEGLSNKEIARKLAISDSTVKVHIGAAFRVLGVTSRARAIAAFQRHDEAFAVLPIRRREAALLVNDQAA